MKKKTRLIALTKRNKNNEIHLKFNEINDSFVLNKKGSIDKTEKLKLGPNIKPFPKGEKLKSEILAKTVGVFGDNITTDDIMPSDSSLLPYRSNIPYLSNYIFSKIDLDFAQRAKKVKDEIKKISNELSGSMILAGENYGQGSSREHAALVPLYLKVRFVLAKSFARIHRSNLINAGILPLTFKNKQDIKSIKLGDVLEIKNVRQSLYKKEAEILNKSKKKKITVFFDFAEEEIKMLETGGKIAVIKKYY